MTFAGFSKDALRFFHELAAEMNRDWWTAHKAEYEALWVGPMTELLEEVRTGLARPYRGIALAEPKLFRIHRDVRFGKDKTPYKTHCAGVIKLDAGAAGVEAGSALYLHLGVEEYSGAGYYAFSPEHLARWRKLVAADPTGKPLAALLAAARPSFELHGHGMLARPPRGVDPAHPRVDLLRQKGCALGFPDIPRGLIHKPVFSTWLIEQATRAAPVIRWIHTNIE